MASLIDTATTAIGKIVTNGKNAITGALLNDALNSIFNIANTSYEESLYKIVVPCSNAINLSSQYRSTEINDISNQNGALMTDFDSEDFGSFIRIGANFDGEYNKIKIGTAGDFEIGAVCEGIIRTENKLTLSSGQSMYLSGYDGNNSYENLSYTKNSPTNGIKLTDNVYINGSAVFNTYANSTHIVSKWGISIGLTDNSVDDFDDVTWFYKDQLYNFIFISQGGTINFYATYNANFYSPVSFMDGNVDINQGEVQLSMDNYAIKVNAESSSRKNLIKTCQNAQFIQEVPKSSFTNILDGGYQKLLGPTFNDMMLNVIYADILVHTHGLTKDTIDVDTLGEFMAENSISCIYFCGVGGYKYINKEGSDSAALLYPQSDNNHYVYLSKKIASATKSTDTWDNPSNIGGFQFDSDGCSDSVGFYLAASSAAFALAYENLLQLPNVTVVSSLSTLYASVNNLNTKIENISSNTSTSTGTNTSTTVTNIIPSADSTYDLGSDSYCWNNLYCNWIRNSDSSIFIQAPTIIIGDMSSALINVDTLENAIYLQSSDVTIGKGAYIFKIEYGKNSAYWECGDAKISLSADDCGSIDLMCDYNGEDNASVKSGTCNYNYLIFENYNATLYNTKGTITLGEKASNSIVVPTNFIVDVPNGTLTLSAAKSITASKAITTSSDIRYKNILNDITLSVEDIANAPFFEFSYKDSEDVTFVGTSAQYWQDICPKAVVETEGKLSLNYSGLALGAATTVAKEVVELKKENETLKAENKAIKTELETFKAELNELKNIINNLK
jgi:hypothetical protein